MKLYSSREWERKTTLEANCTWATLGAGPPKMSGLTREIDRPALVS